MSRHDHQLAAHRRDCRSSHCDYCETIAERRTHPDDRDPLGWMASRAENADTYWRDCGAATTRAVLGLAALLTFAAGVVATVVQAVAS